MNPGARIAGGHRGFVAAAILLLASGCATTFDSVRHPQPGEITVSSANYADTPVKEILASINDATPADPKLTQLKPLAQPKLYVFAKGEFFRSDLSFAEVAKLLVPPLAEKGYIEASSAMRNGSNPGKKFDLVLRVHCGERFWRNPIVRTTELTWDDGLVGKVAFQSLDASGHSTVWDYRAGGSDAALAQIEQAIGNGGTPSSAVLAPGVPPSVGSGGPSRVMSRGQSSAVDTNSHGNAGLNDPSNPMAGLSSELTALPTRDFFLVVIEAFDSKELQRKRGKAGMLWTTFVAVPKRGNETFAQMLPAMLHVAEPYFGETTQGLAVVDNDRARVEVGVPYEVPKP